LQPRFSLWFENTAVLMQSLLAEPPPESRFGSVFQRGEVNIGHIVVAVLDAELFQRLELLVPHSWYILY
jgi:hypothetical protein